MKLEDLILQVENEASKKENLFLDINNNTYVGLITPPIKSLFQRLIKGETFTFKDIFKESNFEAKESYDDKDLECVIKDLDIASLANHYFYSFNKGADGLLRTLVSKEVYLSFLSITYPGTLRDEKITAPVFFIKTKIDVDKDDRIILSLVDSDPVYNRALIKKLKKEFDINIDHHNFVFDVDSYASYIKSKDANEILSVVEQVDILSLPLIEQNKLWFILDSEEKIRTNPLFSILLGQYTGSAISNNLSILTSNDEVINRFYQSLDSTFAGIIKTFNKDTGKYILEEVVTDYLSHGKSVTVVSNHQEEISDLIVRHNLDSLIYDPRGKVNYLNKEAKESLAWVKEEVIDSNPIYDEYIKLYDERRQCFALPFEKNQVTMAHSIANYTALGKAKYHFDLERYTDEDLKMDKSFFKKFTTLTTLHSIPLSKHPFYGLTSRADEQTYNEIQNYIKKTIEDLDNFVSKIKLINSKEWNLEPIESFIDYQRLAKHLAVLKEYDGAFLPYLKMKIDDYHPDELEDLILKFNSISSTRSSIELNVNPSFWNLNLRQTIADLEDKSKYKYTRDSILEIEKNPDRKNFDSFVRLIKIYLDNEDSINGIINRFKDIGLDVSTLDKAMEVQKAFEFKRNMISHARLYDDIDFEESPFFIKFFTDEKMRENLKSNIIPPLEEISAQLSIDFDALRSYFDSGEQKDYETMPFDEVKKYLTTISSESYKSYNDYYQFVLEINNTSLPLKNVIDKLIAEDKTFDYLEVDYFSSIFNAYKDIAIKANKQVETKMRTFKPTWRKNLMVALEESRTDKVNKTFASIQEYLNDLTYRATSREIKRYTYTYDYLHNVSMIRKYSDVIKRTHPIHLVSKTDHYDRLFATDVTIITNFEDLSLIDLLEVIAISHKIIILSVNKDASVEVDGNKMLLNSFVPETVYDLKNLFKSIDYSIIDKHLFNLLEYHANRLGYLLKKNYEVEKDIYPLVLVRPGVSKPSFVLFPDLGMKKNREDILKVTFPLLTSIYKTIPIELPILISSLLPKEILLFSIEPVAIPSLEKKEVRTAKEENSEERKKAYEEKLEELRASFKEKDTLIGASILDDDYILSCLPIKEDELQSCSEAIQNRVKELLEQGIIYKDVATYYPLNKNYLALHKNSGEKVYRQELLIGVFKYISAFSYLPKKTLIEEITSVLGVDKENLFILGEINMVIDELFKDKKISISSDERLSLFKSY